MHGVGKDELAIRDQDPADFVEHAGAVAAMQDRILGPDDIVAAVGVWNVLEIAIYDANVVRKPGLASELLIGGVLGFAEIEARHKAAEPVGQIARRPAIARAQIQDPRGLIYFGDPVRHGFHCAPAGVGDGFNVAVIDADMDILTAPDVLIERIRLGTVIIGFGPFDRAAFTFHGSFFARRE